MDSPASNETPNADKADAKSSVGKLVKIIGSLTTIIAALTVFLNNASIKEFLRHRDRSRIPKTWETALTTYFALGDSGLPGP